MSERDAWEEKFSNEPNRVLRCDEWEGLITDALDGTLTAGDSAVFTRHHRECALCAQKLKETRQGKAWMEYLEGEPAMPAGLREKILARTSARRHPGVSVPLRALPARSAWDRLPFPGQLLEPRLLMTAAMAFFSIALTLNLTGIKLSRLSVTELRPSRLRANLTRQYYSTNEQVMKYYENLRLVYEMEARVRELRHSTEGEPPAGQLPRETPEPSAPAHDGSGGSPSSRSPRDGQIPGQPHIHGDAVRPPIMARAGPQRFYPGRNLA